MPKFIIKIGPTDTQFIENEDICCYIADSQSSKNIVSQAKSSDKLVLGEGEVYSFEADLDGLIIREEVNDKFPKYIKSVQKRIKGKFTGICCRPTRHEAMLASEAEPDFVIFEINPEEQKAAIEVLQWYSELFLIQSAVTYFEKIDKKLLDLADFIILNATEYKILVDKIKRLD